MYPGLPYPAYTLPVHTTPGTPPYTAVPYMLDCTSMQRGDGAGIRLWAQEVLLSLGSLLFLDFSAQCCLSSSRILSGLRSGGRDKNG